MPSLTENKNRNRNIRAFRLLLSAGGALVALLIVAATIFLCRVMVALRAETVRAQASARGRLDQTAEICEEHRAAKQALAEANREVAALKSRLPATVDDTRFLAHLAQLAEKTTVELHSFRPGVLADLATHQELEIRIAAGGQYESLCRLFAELSKLPRCYRISQLNLAAPASGDDVCDAELQLWLAFGLKHPPRLAGAKP